MKNSRIHLPALIAQPLFHLVYRIVRRSAPIPPIRRVVRRYPKEMQVAFDELLESALKQAPNRLIEYDLPYPKADFLNYTCDWRGLVAHGSIFPDLDVLEPVRLTRDRHEFGNRQQIFCSPDGMWALWFAILDKSKIHLTENGCVRVGRGAGRVKYYHFDLPAANQEEPPFADGMIYLARVSDFPDRRPYPLLDWFDAEIEEWGSTRPVTPLAKLPVSPGDFPYLDKVQFHL